MSTHVPSCRLDLELSDSIIDYDLRWEGMYQSCSIPGVQYNFSVYVQIRSVQKIENTDVGIRHADHEAPSIRKIWHWLSPTNGGRSVGILSSLTQATGVFILCTDSIVAHYSSLYCKYIHYMFRPNWPSSTCVLVLCGKPYCPGFFSRLVLCCDHARVLAELALLSRTSIRH
jgi:hypothetical protein